MVEFWVVRQIKFFAIGSLLLFLKNSQAHAQPTSRSEAVDKSSYNLFHPTPRSLMREMTTDRPDKTEAPFTIDAGHFQLEMDLVNYTYDRYTAPGGGPRTETWAIAPFNLRVGVLNNLDLELLVGTYSGLRARESSLGVTRRNGFGDLTPRMTINFWGNDGGSSAFGAIPWVKLPLSQDNLGNNSIEGGLILPLALDLPAGFGMGAMTEVDFIRNDARGGHHPEFVNSITLNHGLAGKLEMYVEFYSSVSTERNSAWIGTVDVGFTYALTPAIQLDTGVNLGVTRSADDFNPFIGLSFRY
jgi:hypothetical protein